MEKISPALMKKHREKKANNAKKNCKSKYTIPSMNIGSCDIFRSDTIAGIIILHTAFDPELLRPFQLHLFWNMCYYILPVLCYN